jgi:hypothetical protein
MTIFQILILILIALVIYKATRRLLKKDLSFLLYLVWIGAWLFVAVFVVWPEILSRLAAFVGIGRGVDLTIYLSIFALFYFVFKISLRQDKMEKNLADIVRKIALTNVNRGVGKKGD